MRDALDPVHHAPGIPCGATSLKKRALAFFYSLEPQSITCRHRGCRAARARLERERPTAAAPALAALEAFG